MLHEARSTLRITYRREARLGGLTKIKIFEPTEVGFVCVAAISNRQVFTPSLPILTSVQSPHRSLA